MLVGDKVKLTGITRHGKNRVREQGETWEVIRLSPTVGVQQKLPVHSCCYRLLSLSICGEVSTINDDNFSVEVIDE